MFIRLDFFINTYMKNLKIFLSTLFFSLSLHANDRISCKVIHPIMETMLKKHLLHNKFTKILEVRTARSFIKTIDPGKVYFIQSDVKNLNNLFDKAFEDIKKQDCSKLHEIHNIHTKKVADRTEFVKKFLNKTYKLDKSATLVADYDLIEVPKTSKEQDDLFEDRLHLQIANLLSDEVDLEKAKELLTKRYERVSNTLKDTETSDLYERWLYLFSQSLDPHTNFMPPPDVDNFQLQMSLSYEGIGAVLVSDEGYVVVDRLIKGGAAYTSGLINVKDKIIAVAQGKNGDFDSVIEMPLTEVVQLIKGPKGTTVRLKILRQVGGERSSMIIPLMREKIELEEDAARIRFTDKELDGKSKKIAVLELPTFYQSDRNGGRSSSRDVSKLLEEANKKNVDGLVLDFSANGGGSLEESINIAGLFIKKGNIVRTIGKNENKILSDKNSGISFNKPVVILNSRFSASASEIVSGALQAYRRVVVVGADHTFGKGTYQTVVPISNEIGQFKITSGMFFTPMGYSTQYIGVKSDIVLPSIYSTDDIGERSLDYSLPERIIKPFLSAESVSGVGTWKIVSDKTIEVLKKESAKRVAKSKEFNEIKKELSKAKKEIKVSEIISPKEIDKKKQDDQTSDRIKIDENFRDHKYMTRPQLVEAINVLLDLVKINETSN